MPAEEIRLELRAEHVGRNVLERAGLRVGAVVEERVERAAGRGEDGIGRRRDRVRLRVVEIERGRARSACSAAMSSGLRAVAKTRQPRVRMPSAAQRPMPVEQPVMRIVRAIGPLRAGKMRAPRRTSFRRADLYGRTPPAGSPAVDGRAGRAERRLSETLSIVVSIFGLIGLGYLAARTRAARTRRSATA